MAHHLTVRQLFELSTGVRFQRGDRIEDPETIELALREHRNSVIRTPELPGVLHDEKPGEDRAAGKRGN